jgi:AraC family transcriptional regulator
MFVPLARDRDLTVGLWRCEPHGPEWSPLERVECAEVVVPLVGAYIRERRQRETFASPNVALFGNAGDGYRVRHPVGHPPDRCAVLLLQPQAVEELRAALGTGGMGAARLPTNAVAVSSATFLAARRLVRAPNADPLRTQELAVNVLLSLVGRAVRSRPARQGREQRRAVLRAQEFIVSRCTSPLSLAAIAEVAGYSTFHFARMFRDDVGVPVYRYVLDLRLRAAADAVLQGAENLSHLALSLGFSSHSHFAAAFRRAFGASPTLLRSRLEALARDEGLDASSHTAKD